MNGGTISYLLSKDSFTRKIYDGFWFPDIPPRLSKLPALIILNTDKSTGPGEHWCAAYFSSSQHCEFFDPLGAPPENSLFGYSFMQHLSAFSKTIEFNIVPVQHINAHTCGPHCIYFAYFRARGYPLKTIVKSFYTSETTANDSIVSKFVDDL